MQHAGHLNVNEIITNYFVWLTNQNMLSLLFSHSKATEHVTLIIGLLSSESGDILRIAKSLACHD